MAAELGLGAAALAGAVYFASPCVWPLYPAYLALLAGAPAARTRTVTLLARALAFLAGFTAVFVALGAAASAVGRLLLDYQPALQRVAGVVIAALGLHMLGFIQLPLPSGWRATRAPDGDPGLVGSVLLGASFALGWTPCVVPVLGTILLLAASAETLVRGVHLLLAFAAGFSVPFLGLALLAGRLAGAWSRAGRAVAALHRAAGWALVGFGAMVYAGVLGRMSAWLFYLSR